MAQRRPHIAIVGQYADGNQHDGAQANAVVGAQLLIAEGLEPVAPQQAEVYEEVGAKQKHKRHDDHLGHRVAVGAHRQVAVRKAARARRAHGVDDAVKQGHAAGQQRHKQHNGHAGVQQIQHAGGIFHAGQQLGIAGARALCAGQVCGVLGDAGHQRQGEHQHAHAPHPVGEAAPEQDGAGQRLHLGQNGGPCGGEARYRLKQGVPVVHRDA